MGWTIDESWSRTDPAADVAAGIDCVSLYLSNDTSKNAKPADIANYHAVGISVLLNFEAGASDALKGAALGTTQANTAIAQARALGAPPHVGIYFSCDTDATVDQVRPYYQAASAVTRAAGYRIGAYGGAAIVIPLMHEGVVDLGWITNASSWNHGTADTGANLHQLLGHPIHVAGSPDTAFDVDQELTAEFGQWTANGAKDLDAGQDAKLTELWSFHKNLALEGSLHTIDARVQTVQATLTAAIASIVKQVTEAVAKANGQAVTVNVDAASVAKAVGDELEKRLAQ